MIIDTRQASFFRLSWIYRNTFLRRRMRSGASGGKFTVCPHGRSSARIESSPGAARQMRGENKNKTSRFIREIATGFKPAGWYGGKRSGLDSLVR
jgi:hypothetical protein